MTKRTRRAFFGTGAAGVTGSWLASRVPAVRAQAPRSGVVAMRSGTLAHTFAAPSVTRLQLTLA